MFRPLPPKILIVDSQMIIAADVFLQCSKLGYDVIGVITHLKDVRSAIKNNLPDIVLLNIEMEGKAEGEKTANAIFNDFNIPVIFLSTKLNKENFKTLNDTHSYAFITKPFAKNDLQRGIDSTLSRMMAEGRWNNKHQAYLPDRPEPTYGNGLFVQQKGQFVKVEIEDILFVEANRNYCQLSIPGKTYQLSVPLKTIENQLPDAQFIRVHRSFLVNLQKVNSLQQYGDYLTIENHKIPISRRLKSKVLKNILRVQ